MSRTMVSLFSGIGGLDLGLERAGFDPVAQVEIDPYCQSVLARHWPEVPRHDDVRTFPDWWAAHPRPAVDLLAGGFPCQPFSKAGLRRGTADPRWGWPWMADAIRSVRPRYVVVENVATLLRDRAFGIVLGDLADLGFDAVWGCVSACSVGASHVRARLFVVAYPRGQGLQGVHPAGLGVDLQSAAGDPRRDWPAEPGVARVADGLPWRVVQPATRALGNSVVPPVAERIGRMIAASM